MSSRSPVCPELTMRECEILSHVAHGLMNKEIARKTGLTLTGVESHMWKIMHKLGLDCRVQLAIYSLKSGLVRLEDIDIEGAREQRRMIA